MFVNKSFLINYPPPPRLIAIHAYTTVALRRVLTNHEALLWVKAGHPWYITFPEAMNVTHCLITGEMSQFVHWRSPICRIRDKHTVCDAVLPPWRGICYVETSHHVSHISVAATIAWRGIWYVKNSHHVSHISMAATSTCRHFICRQYPSCVAHHSGRYQCVARDFVCRK